MANVCSKFFYIGCRDSVWPGINFLCIYMEQVNSIRSVAG